MEGQTPKPPRRPLTPYMRYSKSIWKSVKEGKDEIWQSVKEANPSLSVCEIGATIGKMWRELDDVTKQKYNEDFVQDKARYDEELQAYLKLTGLQASDLTKPKGRKKADAAKMRTNHQSATPPPSQPLATQQTALGLTQMAPPGYPGQPMGMQLPNFPASSPQVTAPGALPHFSQIWTTGQFEGQPGQMMMLNAQGQPVQISNGQAAMAFFQPQLQQLQQQAQQAQQQQQQQADQQQQQPQTAATGQQSSEQISSFNGSPQIPAASASPHLNTASPITGEQQQQQQQAPPNYDQQSGQQQQATAQQQTTGQFDQWALHQQMIDQQQQQLQAVHNFQQQQAESQAVSDGSEAKASPASQLSDTNSPAPAGTAGGIDPPDRSQSITSPGGDSNSVGSSSATEATSSRTQHQQLPQYASAHNNFNSYANFPWGNFPSTGQAQVQSDGSTPATTGSSATDGSGKPVFSKETIQESELSHLRTALSEKTKQVQRLGQELEKTRSLVEQLRAENQQLRAAHVQQQQQHQQQPQEEEATAVRSNSQLSLGMQSSPPTPDTSSPPPM